jgi:hypothetical protein
MKNLLSVLLLTSLCSCRTTNNYAVISTGPDSDGCVMRCRLTHSPESDDLPYCINSCPDTQWRSGDCRYYPSYSSDPNRTTCQEVLVSEVSTGHTVGLVLLLGLVDLVTYSILTSRH